MSHDPKNCCCDHYVVSVGYPCGCGATHAEPWAYEEDENGNCTVHWEKAEWDEMIAECTRRLAEKIDQEVLASLLDKQKG